MDRVVKKVNGMVMAYKHLEQAATLLYDAEEPDAMLETHCIMECLKADIDYITQTNFPLVTRR